MPTAVRSVKESTVVGLIDVDWDRVTHEIGAEIVCIDEYWEEVELGTKRAKIIFLDYSDGTAVRIETNNPKMFPNQKEALHVLRSLGVNPVMFRIGTLNLDRVDDVFIIRFIKDWIVLNEGDTDGI
jgi:hypothetical protein